MINKLLKWYIKQLLKLHGYADRYGVKEIHKFKVGDLVVYNWMAKIDISTAIAEKGGPHRIISIRSQGHYASFIVLGTSWETGADVFWLRKANIKETLAYYKRIEDLRKEKYGEDTRP